MAFSRLRRSPEGNRSGNGPIRAEMRRQLHLLDGDSTDHETFQSIINRNRELIRRLRQENKELHKQKVQSETADEQMIRAAFKRIGKEKETYRNISLKEAVSRAEQMVFDKQKRLNAMKFKTQTYQQQLEELKMKEQVETAAPAVDDRRREDVTMSMRSLENNLEKMQLKYKKATEIRRHYEEIRAQLQGDCLEFPGRLDRLEAEQLKAKEELHRMEDMKKKAQLATDTAEVSCSLHHVLPL
ncbi:coiled-coil domain-containing protein 151 [Genypterus blacodes]|uniref:coiled-coil domain-containing protein 151 n=1 Tax=Genypterus blacodes TaxID=154954 RepID=UPI003F75A812